MANKKAQAVQSDLQVLFPERTVTLSKEKVEVRPFPFGSIPRVIAILGNSIGLLQNAPDLKATVEGDGENKELVLDEKTISFLVDVVGQGGDNIMELIAVAANKDIEYVKALDPDDGLKLAYKCYAVNQDFFKQRLKPLLEVLVKGNPIA